MHFYKRHTIQAFSLIELMVAVAITSVLAAIAIPSYSTYVQASRRSEAINNLLNIQKAYEQSYGQNNSYTSSPPTLPSNTNYYEYTVSATTTTYVLTATAVAGSGQASDTQNGVACTPLSIDNLNSRLPAACWNV